MGGMYQDSGKEEERAYKSSWGKDTRMCSIKKKNFYRLGERK